MEYTLQLKKNDEPDFIAAHRLRVGQLAECLGAIHGVVLGTYDGMVSLSNPNRTWDFRRQQTNCPIILRPLETGESVTLTVSEGGE